MLHTNQRLTNLRPRLGLAPGFRGCPTSSIEALSAPVFWLCSAFSTGCDGRSIGLAREFVEKEEGAARNALWVRFWLRRTGLVTACFGLRARN